MILFLLALQSASPVAADPKRYQACIELARRDPAKAVLTATEWRLGNGGYLAEQCLAVSYANQARWPEAAKAFDAAAAGADAAKDERAGDFRAQAGNAWLAAGDAAKARAALDAAIASGKLAGPALGEAQLDRARVEVQAGDPAAGRSDIDSALSLAPNEPLGWLLSATLARRENDVPRAAKDIATALRIAPEEPSVQLEAGNIAALQGDEAGARSAWQQVIRLAPGSPQAISARNALTQFGAEK
jgi:Tfp pilus assembly protein PilF